MTADTAVSSAGNRSKRVIVTGANGFIGRHAVAALLERGWEVHAVGLGTPLRDEPGLVWREVNLLDNEAASALCAAAGASHLLHLAWYAEPGKYWNSPENFRWVKGSLDLLDAFRVSGGAEVVLAGTCAEYDWNYGCLNEELTPMAPASVYGRCKNAFHQLAAAYAELYGMRLAWGRVFFLYGPFEAPGRLVSSVIGALLRDEEARCSHGRQIRDFLHVFDVGSAFATLLESEARGAFNIGSGQPVALARIVELIALELAKPQLVRLGALPSPPDEAPLVVADCRRLHALGWQPRYDLERGIADTVAWWRSRTTI